MFIFCWWLLFCLIYLSSLSSSQDKRVVEIYTLNDLVAKDKNQEKCKKNILLFFQSLKFFYLPASLCGFINKLVAFFPLDFFGLA